jgi:hypothetical protein
MADLAKLVVSLEAQTAKYQRELEKANKKLSGFERRQKRSLANISRAFKSLAVAVAGIGFGRLIKNAIDLQDQAAKVSTRLGITTEAFSELNFAAESAGVNMRTFELGLQRMTRRVAEAAAGTGEAKGALEELGLQADILAQLPLEDQLGAISDALAGIESDADRVRLAFKLFDAEGVTFLQFLKDGSAGLDQMRMKARDLGVTITDDAAKAAEEAKNRFIEFEAVLGGLSRELANTLLPVLTDAAEAFRQIVVGLQVVFGAKQAFPLEDELQRLDEQARQLRGTIEELVVLNDGSTQSPVIQARIAELRDLEFQYEALKKKQLDLLTGGTVADTKRNDELKTQLSLLKEITVEAKKRETSFAPPELLDLELTLETRQDRILRPGVQEDVQLLERSFSLLNEDLKEADQLTQDLGFTFESAFENAIIEGNNLRSVMQGLIDDILRIAIRTTITQPLGNFFGGLFGGIFGGGRQHGGPVSPGQAFLVGEAGPELFVPNTSGRIVPQGAGGHTFNFTTNIQAGVDPGRLVPILEQNNRKLKGEIVDELDRGKYQ